MDFMDKPEWAGARPPTSDEAYDSPQIAGPNEQESIYLNTTAQLVPVQATLQEVSIYARLSRQFSMIGLRLYPLDGQTLLVSSPHLGMFTTLPDLRAAQVYLRRIGGVR